jgi:hypothetical protein
MSTLSLSLRSLYLLLALFLRSLTHSSVCRVPVCAQVFFNLASATRWSDCSWDEACAEVRVDAHAVYVRVCVCVCVCVCVWSVCAVCVWWVWMSVSIVWTSVCRGHHVVKDAAPHSLSSACVPC